MTIERAPLRQVRRRALPVPGRPCAHRPAPRPTLVPHRRRRRGSRAGRGLPECLRRVFGLVGGSPHHGAGRTARSSPRSTPRCGRTTPRTSSGSPPPTSAAAPGSTLWPTSPPLCRQASRTASRPRCGRPCRPTASRSACRTTPTSQRPWTTRTTVPGRASLTCPPSWTLRGRGTSGPGCSSSSRVRARPATRPRGRRRWPRSSVGRARVAARRPAGPGRARPRLAHGDVAFLGAPDAAGPRDLPALLRGEDGEQRPGASGRRGSRVVGRPARAAPCAGRYPETLVPFRAHAPGSR